MPAKPVGRREALLIGKIQIFLIGPLLPGSRTLLRGKCYLSALVVHEPILGVRDSRQPLFTPVKKYDSRGALGRRHLVDHCGVLVLSEEKPQPIECNVFIGQNWKQER